LPKKSNQQKLEPIEEPNEEYFYREIKKTEKKL
jgi:hypothetical protein